MDEQLNHSKQPTAISPAGRTSDRARPRWACAIHDLGDDLRWALAAWCDFPRPIRRVSAAVIATIGGRLLGAGELVSALTRVIAE